MFEGSLRRLTSAVTVAALALGLMTAAAVPARANDDTARVIGGLAAIALGAKIIHDNKERDKERERQSRWQDRDDDDRGWHRGRDRDHDRGRGRDHDRREARLPERCISDYDRRRGQVIAVYNEDCLRQHARR